MIKLAIVFVCIAIVIIGWSACALAGWCDDGMEES